MPDRIKHLQQDLINQIAAGEVVERPASVLKELLENAIDAGSTHIVIKIEKGGTRLISVADNGIGMSGKDSLYAFDRHATSKISSTDDLFNIHTLGFRGEALSSIAAVSRVQLTTRERDSSTGTYVEIEGGSLVKSMETGCPAGTEIVVGDIFYNVPARKSFLKSPATELGHMISIVTQLALANRGVHFVMINADKGSKTTLDFPPVESLEERIFQIHGDDVVDQLADIYFETGAVQLQGLVSNPLRTFKGKDNQLFFVNKRAIRNAAISHAVQAAYLDLIPRDRYPMAVLFIEMDPLLVDVNVHPSKREVKFRDNKFIHDMVVEAIRDSLRTKDRQYTFTDKEGLEHNRYEVHEGISNPFIDGMELSGQEKMPIGPSVRILGQISALFIVAEINGELSIIDQHAAHERVIYDRLKRGYTSGKVEAQYLLIPETMELSLARAHVLKEYTGTLGIIGFDIEELGDRSFMVRTIPATFIGEDCKLLLSDMLDEIMERDLLPSRDMKLSVTEDIIKALLSRKACHNAVRAKGLLTDREMSSLLLDLLRTDMPYTCPHGRPMLKRFSSEELEKMFGRK